MISLRINNEIPFLIINNMKYLITIFIFFIVLFLYLHIQYQLKTSNDLEIYTIDDPSKDKLEEICDLRQPVILNMDIGNISSNCNLATLDDNYGAFDIKIRNTVNTNTNNELYLPIILTEAIRVFQSDEDSKFITESNSDFLDETGVIKYYKYNDEFFRPPMVSKCMYDFWSGSKGAITPLRYHNNYRNYFYVTAGSVKVKLIPPHYSRYLNIQKDHENAEYRSPVNPWNVHHSHKAEFNKVKILDLELHQGMILAIPAYWCYSMKYQDMSSICVLQYRTYMNTIAILPDLIIQLLQKQNIKRKTVANTEEVPPEEVPIVTDKDKDNATVMAAASSKIESAQ